MFDAPVVRGIANCLQQDAALGTLGSLRLASHATEDVAIKEHRKVTVVALNGGRAGLNDELLEEVMGRRGHEDIEYAPVSCQHLAPRATLTLLPRFLVVNIKASQRFPLRFSNIAAATATGLPRLKAVVGFDPSRADENGRDCHSGDDNRGLRTLHRRPPALANRRTMRGARDGRAGRRPRLASPRLRSHGTILRLVRHLRRSPSSHRPLPPSDLLANRTRPRFSYRTRQGLCRCHRE